MHLQYRARTCKQYIPRSLASNHKIVSHAFLAGWSIFYFYNNWRVSERYSYCSLGIPFRRDYHFEWYKPNLDMNMYTKHVY